MLELRNINKRFGPEPALESVNLEVAAGEIHGLVGLNGSGKSTLLNILFGSSTIQETGGYSGTYLLDGRVRRFSSPCQAIRCGIGMVHQEFALIPEMTVTENILISREKGYSFFDTLFPRDFSLVDRTSNAIAARQTLHHLKLDLDPDQITGRLSINIRQLIEIAREISRDDLRLLLLDEPTAVLNTADTDQFLTTLRSLADKGIAILFVSHRLQEILQLCDRLTVLREGKVVSCCAARDSSIETVTRLMVRESVVKVSRTRRQADSPPILSVREFRVRMAGEELHGLDLDVHRNEILGIISLSGHGKLAFGAGVIGQVPFCGRLRLTGEDCSPSPCSAMIRRGLFFLSEERSQLGLLLQHSIMDNIVFAALHHNKRFHHPLWPHWLQVPDQKAIRRHAAHCIAEYDIRCTGPLQSVGDLSGGNQQKIRIAHALTLSPQLLIVNEPTRGIDIAAKERILKLFLDVNHREGTTIVIASSELDELKRICDRIAVLYRGRLHAILDPAADDLLFTRAISGEAVLQ